MNLSVVIPVYNEEATVRELLQRVLSLSTECEVIVVDDGSTDKTPEILKSFQDSRIKLCLKKNNEGKAAALRRGIKMASGKYILFQDADLEYDPADYDKLLQAAADSSTNTVVYGNRFPKGGKNMFFRQKAANKILTMLTNVLYNGSVGDMETCYKLVPARVLKYLDLREEGFGVEPEITLKLLKKGHKIINVPISYSGRSYSQGKKIGFKDALSALWILIKYRFFIKAEKNI
ncbi:MAG: glycosyltransferase family 2 protein [Elusimicrobiota bacterium]